MDARDKVLSAGNALTDISTIEIEKEPCPRCAVVLNKLGLAGKVTYKEIGQKDYPTWRYPCAHLVNWANVMGISAKVTHDDDKTLLLNHFYTQKWWS
jgi:hypothetical protein